MVLYNIGMARRTIFIAEIRWSFAVVSILIASACSMADMDHHVTWFAAEALCLSTNATQAVLVTKFCLTSMPTWRRLPCLDSTKMFRGSA